MMFPLGPTHACRGPRSSRRPGQADTGLVASTAISRYKQCPAPRCNTCCCQLFRYFGGRYGSGCLGGTNASLSPPPAGLRDQQRSFDKLLQNAVLSVPSCSGSALFNSDLSRPSLPPKTDDGVAVRLARHRTYLMIGCRSCHTNNTLGGS